MNTIPSELKNTYLVIFAIFILLIVFVIAFIIIFKNKQTTLYSENLMQEALLKQQKLEAELEKIQALQSERDRISSDMHDDLGSGLSSIKLISQMLKAKHQDESTQEDLNEIVEHATELTDSMREMVWSLNPRNDNLQSFVDHVTKYSKSFFEPSKVIFKLRTVQEIPEKDMNGFVRRNIFLSIKEVFNNIIKHALANNVDMLISVSNDRLHVSINDDGIGLSSTESHGNGLYNLKKRMNACGGLVEWKNTNPGLQVDLSIPI